MMYPRLKLARNLLTEDGVIFISIDDYEMHNLRKICDEIFSEFNSLTESPTSLIWKKSSSTAGHFSSAHEYLLVYCKDKNKLPFFSLNDYGEDSIIEHSALKKISKSNPASKIISVSYTHLDVYKRQAIEKEFAENLEQATEVIVYAKLPKSFYISTPVAHYSPDWAIVLDKEKVRHIYFVAETKGSDDVNQLRDIEKLKIHCAQEHFRTISGNEVKFDVITNYSKLLEVAQLK